MRMIVKLYVDAIRNGEKTIEEVPAKLREEVLRELEK